MLRMEDFSYKDDTERRLTQSHKRLLLKEFGMVFPSN